MTTNTNRVLFSSPFLTIDGTYTQTKSGPVIHITETDFGPLHVQENITLTGLAATAFIDIFHPHLTYV